LRGLTQDRLARSIGVSQKMIDYYERRAVNIKSETIRKLAHALQISVDELMGTKPPKAKPGPKSRLMRQFEQVERLPKADQELVGRLLNRFLDKAA
jgi:transcriptional regulator with XRE-family HTH domain